MPTLTPVDYDPFAQQSGPRLVPVDGDPFAQESPRSAVETYVTRPLGQAARYTMEGLGGTIGIFSDPIANAMGVMPAGQLATTAADKLGLPKPEGGFEEVVAGASRAVAGGAPFLRAGQVAAQAPGLTGRVGQAVADAPVLQGVSAATGGASAETARQMGASPGMQAAAGLAGAIAPSATAAATRGLVRGGEQGRQNMLNTIRQFEDAGAGTPTVGQATEGRVARGAEGLLSRTPGGAGIMARTAEAQQEGMGRQVRAVADSLSPRASPEQAGRGIERGITGPGGFMESFRGKSGELYDEVGRLLPPDTRVPAASTIAKLNDLSTPIAGATNTSQALLNSRVSTIAKAFQDDLAANGGFMPYNSIKQLRTQVGELIGDSVLSPDAPTRQLRALYGAMSDDMTEAAKAAGDPRVLQAARRANNYHRAASERLEQIERVIDRNGGPEKVFAAATNGSREGATTLRAVMQSLPQDARKQLSAAMIRRMGRANPSAQDDVGEAFSSERFLTMWNTLAPEAKTTLFGRYGPSYVRDMEVLAKSAANIRDGSKAFANPSGTTQAAGQLVTSGSMLFALASGNAPTAAYIGGGVLAANAMARAMTSPTVVKWLAKQTTAPAVALAPQIAALKAEAQAKGDEEALEFARQLDQLAAEQAPKP